MTLFLGNQGSVKLRRGSQFQFGFLESVISTDDINTSLNRIGVDEAVTNILTGDRVEITTTDPRKLIFFPASTWTDYAVNNSISAFVNVNAVGGLRFYRSFADAINNDRTMEIPVTSFAGASIPIRISVKDVSFNVLGFVRSYEFSTDREAIDSTTLNDKFRQQYSAGLISGSGRIECAFSYKTSGITETPLLITQLIQRVDIGSACDLNLYLTETEVNPNVETVFYDLAAVITRAGVQVAAGSTVECTLDFITTGDIKLVYGRPSDYILKEDSERINLEQSLDFLLTEETD